MVVSAMGVRARIVNASPDQRDGDDQRGEQALHRASPNAAGALARPRMTACATASDATAARRTVVSSIVSIGGASIQPSAQRRAVAVDPNMSGAIHHIRSTKTNAAARMAADAIGVRHVNS